MPYKNVHFTGILMMSKHQLQKYKRHGLQLCPKFTLLKIMYTSSSQEESFISVSTQADKRKVRSGIR